MTAFPTLKLKVVPTFPSNIIGGTGIDVTKANGAVTVDLAFGEFGTQSSIPTSPTSNVLTYDTATNSYIMIPSSLLGGAVAGISDAPVDGTSYARNSAAWVPIVNVPSGSTSGYLLQTNGVGTGATWNGFVQAGTGVATRTWQSKARDRHDLRDYSGLDLTGVNDNAALVASALADSASNGTLLHIPAGIIALGSTVNWPEGASWEGVNRPAKGWNQNPVVGDGQSWFHITHTGIGFSATAGAANQMRARSARRFGTYRNQPTPGVSAYTPTNHQWDIYCAGVNDVTIDEWMMLNSTRGFAAVGVPAGGSGRIRLGRITGQPLLIGIYIEHCYDIVSINGVHFWTYWALNTEVLKSMTANAIALAMGRCDNPQIDDIFTYGYRNALYLFKSVDVDPVNTLGGSANNFQIGKIQADSTETGIFVESTAAPTGHIQDYLAGRSSGVFGSTSAVATAVRIDGTGSDIAIDNIKVDYGAISHITITSSANRLKLGNCNFSRHDQSVSGASVCNVAVNNVLDVTGRIVHDTTDDKIFSGSGIQTGPIYRSHTLNPVSVTGAFGSLGTVSAKFERMVDDIQLHFSIPITNIGTGNGGINVTLPFIAALPASGTVKDTTLNQTLGHIYIASGSATARIVKYDGTFLGADGMTISGSLRYKA